jgi:hypothetical protein
MEARPDVDRYGFRGNQDQMNVRLDGIQLE